MADKEKTRKQRVAERKDTRRQKVAAVQNKIKNVAAKKSGKQNQPNTVTQNRLELMVTIVNRSKAEYYLDLIQSFEVNMQFLALAHGTADEKMRSYIGLTDSDKAVIFSVIQENKISDAMHLLEKKFATIKNGKGIAYTLPLSSIIGTLIYGFLSNNKMAVKETKQS